MSNHGVDNNINICGNVCVNVVLDGQGMVRDGMGWLGDGWGMVGGWYGMVWGWYGMVWDGMVPYLWKVMCISQSDCPP